MSNMFPLQAFVDKRLFPLVLTALAIMPRRKLLDLLLPLVAWLLEQNQANDPDSSFEHFEHQLNAVLTDLGRFTTERRLLREAANQPPALLIDDVPHKAVAYGSVTVHHPYGSLNVPRWRYRRVGARNEKTVGFLEAKLGLINGSTPRLAKCQAEHMAAGPSRRAVSLMESAGMVAPTRARQDRWGRSVSKQLAQNLQDVMSDVRTQHKPPSTTARILVSLDRFRVVMHEDAPGKPMSEATRRYRKRVPYQRKPPEPFELAGRMVYAASVTLYDDEGRSLGTFRYGAPHDSDPAQLVAQLRQDVAWVRQHKPGAQLDVCLDGAKELWRVMKDGLEGVLGEPARLVLDWYHFWERTHPVLKLLFDEVRVTWWRHKASRQAGGVAAMLKAMWRRVAQIHRQSVYDEVAKYDKYLKQREGLFDYAGQRTAERSRGSGAVESTCKQLGGRVRRCGQRWKEDGISAILALRAAYDSRASHDRKQPDMDRWSLIWNSFASSFRRQIRFLGAAA